MNLLYEEQVYSNNMKYVSEHRSFFSNDWYQMINITYC